jgi:periplasmic protein CpxP/Spy
MNKDHDNNAGQAATRATGGKRRWLIATALAVTVGTAGVAFANGGPHTLGHHGAGPMAMNPAALDTHIDKMVDQFAADASADQKARMAAIAKAAIADLRPAHAQMRQGHARLHELLTAPVIDRAALEQLRAEQMQRMDFISKRILAAVEDAADVLTPAQRVAFGDRLKAHMH